MLRKLKTKVAPGVHSREAMLRKRYLEVCKSYSKKEDLETWLQRWERVYDACRNANLPEVQSHRAHYVLDATAKLDPKFNITWTGRIDDQVKKDEELTPISELINSFRTRRQVQSSRDSEKKESVYIATLQGHTSPAQKEEDDSSSQSFQSPRTNEGKQFPK